MTEVKSYVVHEASDGSVFTTRAEAIAHNQGVELRSALTDYTSIEAPISPKAVMSIIEDMTSDGDAISGADLLERLMHAGADGCFVSVDAIVASAKFQPVEEEEPVHAVGVPVLPTPSVWGIIKGWFVKSDNGVAEYANRVRASQPAEPKPVRGLRPRKRMSRGATADTE